MARGARREPNRLALGGVGMRFGSRSLRAPAPDRQVESCFGGVIGPSLGDPGGRKNTEDRGDNRLFHIKTLAPFLIDHQLPRPPCSYVPSLANNLRAPLNVRLHEFRRSLSTFQTKSVHLIPDQQEAGANNADHEWELRSRSPSDRLKRLRPSSSADAARSAQSFQATACRP